MAARAGGVDGLSQAVVMAGAETEREESAKEATTKLDPYEGRGALQGCEAPAPLTLSKGAKAGFRFHGTDFTQDVVRFGRLLLSFVPVEPTGLSHFSSL